MNILPPWTLIVFIVILVAVLLVSIRKFIPFRLLHSHHEVAFPIFLQVGLFYAVLLAFMFSLEWDEYVRAEQRVQREAGNLLVLMHFSRGFDAGTKQKIRHEVIDYTKFIINEDWAQMKLGKGAINIWGRLNKLQNIYMNFEPKTPGQTFFYTESLKHLENLREYRQMRIFKMNERPLNRVRMMLVGMGVIVVGISFLFAMRYLVSQIILTCCLAAMITAILMIIFFISTPFSGRFALQPRPFEVLLIKFNQLEDHLSGKMHANQISSGKGRGIDLKS